MTTFGTRIRPAVDAELQAAKTADNAGQAQLSFRHLERAHVLGQASTVQHVRVHVRMLLWGLKQKSRREVAGQVLRIVGAVTKTAIGWVPAGNTGGANVSPIKPLPIPEDLRRTIERARS
jgi:hypothetical protein|uniref:DUF3703 domain-containing protein n=1 Tax=uncultured Acidovorax sp. TaxID=158751 RepID=UPI000769F11A|nr:DUF3703 domain-containing protein [uncultured Acidovorax sp.]